MGKQALGQSQEIHVFDGILSQIKYIDIGFKMPHETLPCGHISRPITLTHCHLVA